MRGTTGKKAGKKDPEAKIDICCKVKTKKKPVKKGKIGVAGKIEMPVQIPADQCKKGSPLLAKMAKRFRTAIAKGTGFNETFVKTTSMNCVQRRRPGSVALPFVCQI